LSRSLGRDLTEITKFGVTAEIGGPSFSSPLPQRLDDVPFLGLRVGEVPLQSFCDATGVVTQKNARER
jgi:hypothetical protein